MKSYFEDKTSFSHLKEVLDKYSFCCRKKWGQTFLFDENVIRKIVRKANLSNDDIVVEIGTGAGTLTDFLAREAKMVITIEVDKRLLPVLKETLANHSNIEMVFEDALEVDFDNLVKEKVKGRFGLDLTAYKVVGNLPYYITTPLLMHLLEENFYFSFLLIMIQKEVAFRLVARPGSKDYGSLSVAVQYYTEPEMLFKVPKTVFYPRPDVDSVVACLVRREKPAVEVPDEGLFFRLVRCAFAQRRKTILNSLFNSGAVSNFTRQTWEEVLKSASVDPLRRGETLSLEEFAGLTRSCWEKLFKFPGKK